MICSICVEILKYRRGCISERTEFADLDGEDYETEDDDEIDIRPERREEDTEGREIHAQEVIEDDTSSEYEDEAESEADVIDHIELSPWQKGPLLVFGHHRTHIGLERSASSGCHICQPVWDRLSESERSSLPLPASQETSTQEHNADSIETDVKYFTYLRLCRVRNSEEELALSVSYNGAFTNARLYNRGTLFTLRRANENQSNPSPSTHLPLIHLESTETARYKEHQASSDSTSSEEALNMSRKWLQTCTEQHGACNRQNSQEKYYPTRVLLLDEPGGSKSTVRLVTTAEEHMTGEYTTLSHRWGKAHFIQLNRHTYEAFHTCIKLEDMPKTFQDAIDVSRRLGARYLWIDSLCIMQDKDDLSDWFREAELMHKVYSYSYCNISASDGADSSEGLFRPREQHMLQKATVKVLVRPEHPTLIFNSFSLEHNEFWRLYVSESPIIERGWVFQERTLAPRVLHFSRYQLFWECRENNACEMYPQKLPSIGLTSDCFKASFDYDYGSKLKSYADHQYTWVRVVLAYSRTHLTNPNDKLIALSGIAKAFATAMSDTYIAGLWRKDLAHQLSWYYSDEGAEYEYQLPSRPTNYRAPSWTWASVDVPVYPTCRSTMIGTDGHDELLVTVKDFHLEYATKDITGRITGGWLDITGDIRPMWLNDHTKLRNGASTWNITINNCPDDIMISVSLDAPETYPGEFDQLSIQGLLFYLPMSVPLRDDDDDERFLKFLVLHSLPSRNGSYQRIGLGFCVAETDQENMLVELDMENKRKLPVLQHNNSGCTIRMI